MRRPGRRLPECLTVTFEYLSVVCIAILTILVIAQVVLRYVFNNPLTWSEEMSRIVFFYLAFVGISAAYGRRRHMFVDALVLILPARLARAVQVSVVGMASLFLLGVIAVTIWTAIDLYRTEMNTPALDFPVAFIYLIIPLGLSALIAQMWIDLYRERES